MLTTWELLLPDPVPCPPVAAKLKLRNWNLIGVRPVSSSTPPSGGAVTLTLNTSIVNLFNSTRATTQFKNPGTYYYAPSRQFSFDVNFMTSYKQPPGTPMLNAVLRSKWTVPPPSTTTYAGN